MTVDINPNMAGNRISEDSLIRGDAIKNVKVTPIGIPAPRKPMNNGIDEQEQNGVTTPNIAANK
jgi:hypothetical protein